METALEIISAALARIEAKLDGKADKADIARLEGRLDSHGDRIASIEKVQSVADAAIHAVRRHKRIRIDRRHRLVQTACVVLSLAAIIVSLHPF